MRLVVALHAIVARDGDGVTEAAPDAKTEANA